MLFVGENLQRAPRCVARTARAEAGSHFSLFLNLRNKYQETKRTCLATRKYWNGTYWV